MLYGYITSDGVEGCLIERTRIMITFKGMFVYSSCLAVSIAAGVGEFPATMLAICLILSSALR